MPLKLFYVERCSKWGESYMSSPSGRNQSAIAGFHSAGIADVPLLPKWVDIAAAARQSPSNTSRQDLVICVFSKTPVERVPNAATDTRRKPNRCISAANGALNP